MTNNYWNSHIQVAELESKQDTNIGYDNWGQLPPPVHSFCYKLINIFIFVNNKNYMFALTKIYWIFYLWKIQKKKMINWWMIVWLYRHKISLKYEDMCCEFELKYLINKLTYMEQNRCSNQYQSSLKQQQQ